MSEVYKIGSRGGRVSAIQKRLIANLSNPSLEKRIQNEMGHFGSATHEATRWFQKEVQLKSDGVVGHFTNLILFENNWVYSQPKPRKVMQSGHLCWAAALESMLEKIPRENQTANEIKADFETYWINKEFALSEAGMIQVTKTYKLVSIFPKGATMEGYFHPGFMYKFLKSGYPLYYTQKGAGIGHVKLMYGLRVSEGEAQMLFMDPWAGYNHSSFYAEKNKRGSLDIFCPQEILGRR